MFSTRKTQLHTNNPSTQTTSPNTLLWTTRRGLSPNKPKTETFQKRNAYVSALGAREVPSKVCCMNFCWKSNGHCDYSISSNVFWKLLNQNACGRKPQEKLSTKKRIKKGSKDVLFFVIGERLQGFFCEFLACFLPHFSLLLNVTKICWSDSLEILQRSLYYFVLAEVGCVIMLWCEVVEGMQKPIVPFNTEHLKFPSFDDWRSSVVHHRIPSKTVPSTVMCVSAMLRWRMIV